MEGSFMAQNPNESVERPQPVPEPRPEIEREQDRPRDEKGIQDIEDIDGQDVDPDSAESENDRDDSSTA
jgi:hypothetical protein